MNTSLLGQLVALAGLIGAIGAYAGVLRRRNVVRDAIRVANEATSAAIDRVARLRGLDRVTADRTRDQPKGGRHDSPGPSATTVAPAVWAAAVVPSRARFTVWR